MTIASVALRVQQLQWRDQVLILARLLEGRSESAQFRASEIDRLFQDLGLPGPAKTPNVLAALRRAQMVRPIASHGVWRLTPKGRSTSTELISDMDLTALVAEASLRGGPDFGNAVHPVIPPTFAPPGLLGPLRQFIAEHPFDTNVFGMTRFPDEQDSTQSDPLASAIRVARETCALHGLRFHLASDRAIVDDLWTNVTAHAWASRYGIGFFEDRRGKGLNYNLTIEVGAMLVTGRRLALLRDKSIAKMPTDLVGAIYKPVDLDIDRQVSDAIHRWLRDDLSLPECKHCP